MNVVTSVQFIVIPEIIETFAKTSKRRFNLVHQTSRRILEIQTVLLSRLSQFFLNFLGFIKNKVYESQLRQIIEQQYSETLTLRNGNFCCSCSFSETCYYFNFNISLVLFFLSLQLHTQSGFIPGHFYGGFPPKRNPPKQFWTN